MAAIYKRMLRKIPYAIGLISLAACSAETPPAPQEISYEMRPYLHEGQLHILVDLRFPGDTDGVTEIIIPQTWEREPGLAQQFSHFTPRGISEGKADIWFGADASRFKIEHKPGAAMHISYQFKQRYPGTPLWTTGGIPGIHPLLQPEGAVFIGHAAFPHPNYDGMRAVQPATIAVKAEKLPETWSARSTLGDLEDGVRADIGVSGLQDALFVIGELSFSDLADGPTYATFDSDPRFGLSFDLPEASDVDFIADIMVPPIGADEVAYAYRVNRGLIVVSSEMATAEQRQTAVNAAFE